MPTPLTLPVLLQMRCAHPGCKHEDDEIVLAGRCHPHAPVKVYFVKKTMLIEIRCSRCNKLVCEIEPAPGVSDGEA